MAPQWGSNSKDDSLSSIYDVNTSFSPRNGEVILKRKIRPFLPWSTCFSPRNGEVILKVTKLANWQKRLVSVPAMGK